MTNPKLWRYPEAFRVRATDQFSRCENVGSLAKELGIPRQTLYRWHEPSERAKFF
jgi:transposase-like protein